MAVSKPSPILAGQKAIVVRANLERRLAQCVKLGDRQGAIDALAAALAATDAFLATPSDASLSAAAVASWQPLRRFFGDAGRLLSSTRARRSGDLAEPGDIPLTIADVDISISLRRQKLGWTVRADAVAHHRQILEILERARADLVAAKDDLAAAKAAYAPVRNLPPPPPSFEPNQGENAWKRKSAGPTSALPSFVECARTARAWAPAPSRSATASPATP